MSLILDRPPHHINKIHINKINMGRTTYKLGDKKKISITDFRDNIYVHFNSLVDKDKQISLSAEEFKLLESLNHKIKKAIKKESLAIKKKETNKKNKRNQESENSSESEDEETKPKKKLKEKEKIRKRNKKTKNTQKQKQKSKKTQAQIDSMSEESDSSSDEEATMSTDED